jgi:ubiquinol oxidase
VFAVFAEENKQLLQQLPPPAVAVAYYRGSDVYMFKSFQISKEALESPRDPACNNMYDVFINIRDDEIEHKKTMVACQDPAAIAKEIADASK